MAPTWRVKELRFDLLMWLDLAEVNGTHPRGSHLVWNCFACGLGPEFSCLIFAFYFQFLLSSLSLSRIRPNFSSCGLDIENVVKDNKNGIISIF